jgi:hypothetical protein
MYILLREAFIMPVLKNGVVTQDRRLDRIPQFDERTKDYPIRRLISTEKSLRSYTHKVNVWFDQGQEGACVEYGISHELVANPVRVNATHVSDMLGQHKIYWAAQRNDPWEGGAYPGADPFYEGTSVLSGMQVATELGYYSNYLWAQNENEVALAIGYKGPVVIGVNWYEGMYEPDSDGFLNVTGAQVGGHCTLLYGVSISGDYYKLWNSWGQSWGNNGTAKIRRTDVVRLLSEDGEFCLPTRTPLVD